MQSEQQQFMAFVHLSTWLFYMQWDKTKTTTAFLTDSQTLAVEDRWAISVILKFCLFHSNILLTYITCW